ncbi:XRE family transcriptional regulator, partial (plasmid) [Metabacillus sp. FJAT-52054]
GELMDVCPSTVGKLERGDLKFSSRYEKKLRLAIKRLRVSGVELINIRKMLEMKESKGYRS